MLRQRGEARPTVMPKSNIGNCERVSKITLIWNCGPEKGRLGIRGAEEASPAKAVGQ